MLKNIFKYPVITIKQLTGCAWVCFIAILMSIGVSTTASAAGNVDSYALKAAYVLNFAKFTRWPEGSLNTEDTVKLYVLGNKSLQAPFKTVQGKKIGDRKLDVKVVSLIDEIGDCDMIFVAGHRGKASLARIFKKIKNKPVLTIGEQRSFVAGGGIINFVYKDGKQRFEISPDNAKAQQGITLSSRLLQLAIIID